MSWHPNDLVADQDLADYEQNILTRFGASSWLGRRSKVLEDWLFPILRANGFDPHRLRTRFQPDVVLGFTGSAYTDLTGVARDDADDDLNLAGVLVTPGTDAIYIGSMAPFRGLHWRLLDAVSSVTGAAAVSYWNDAWTSLVMVDGTAHVAGKSFSGGGSMTWAMVPDWTIRRVNASAPLYWVKVTVNASPTGAKASQIGCIRRSALCAPATLRTLMLIFREAPTAQDGPWKEKADYYESEADAAMQRALPILAGEFNTQTPDAPTDTISSTEATQAAGVAQGNNGWRMERG